MKDLEDVFLDYQVYFLLFNTVWSNFFKLKFLITFFYLSIKIFLMTLLNVQGCIVDELKKIVGEGLNSRVYNHTKYPGYPGSLISSYSKSHTERNPFKILSRTENEGIQAKTLLHTQLDNSLTMKLFHFRYFFF